MKKIMVLLIGIFFVLSYSVALGDENWANLASVANFSMEITSDNPNTHSGPLIYKQNDTPRISIKFHADNPSSTLYVQVLRYASPSSCVSVGGKWVSMGTNVPIQSSNIVALSTYGFAVRSNTTESMQLNGRLSQ